MCTHAKQLSTVLARGVAIKQRALHRVAAARTMRRTPSLSMRLAAARRVPLLTSQREHSHATWAFAVFIPPPLISSSFLLIL